MKKGIQKKVVIFILLVGILPLITGITLTYLYGMNSLKNSIGTNFKELARETAKGIDLMLNKEIDEVTALFFSEDVRFLMKGIDDENSNDLSKNRYLDNIAAIKIRNYTKYR